MPVTSAVLSANGYTDGAFNYAWDGVANIIDKIKSLFEQPKGQDVEQAEQIPTISGAKNRSGANQPIPILLGESRYAPIYACQPYTDINPSDGSDGANQYFHALYILGYRDIDVKSVSLGIFKLSSTRHNGTSGTFDCENAEKETTTQNATIDIPQIYLTNPPVGASPATPINLSSLFRDKNILSINTIDTSNLTVKSASNQASAYRYEGQTETITGSRKDGSCVYVEHTCEHTNYPYMTGKLDVNVTVRDKKGVTHYKQSKYHQQLEIQQTLVDGHGSEVSLFPQKVVQENIGTELMHPEGEDWLTVLPFSAKYPQKIQIEILFQNLVHFTNDGGKYDKDNENAETVIIGCAYSTDGGVSFSPFPIFQQSSGDPIVTSDGIGTFSDGAGTYQKTKFKGCKNKAMRFIAEKTFSYNEVIDNVKNNIIEFRIFRVSVDQSVTDTKHQSKCYCSAIRTWCYDYDKSKENGSVLQPQRPLAEKYRDMTARLGFTIKAGDELNGTIDELNVMMKSRAPIYTESRYGSFLRRWENASTNNPASLALMLLKHPSRGEYAYDGTKIDMSSFADFYDWCNQTDGNLISSNGHKYTANGVVSKQFKTIDLVNQVLSCGHGRLIIKNNKYAVQFDQPLDTPVMVLNNQNVLEAKNSKAFAEEIDGYSCRFIDSLNDYQEDTQIFVPKNLNKDPATYKLESLELPWITDCKRAYRQAMYQLACRKLRPETWEVKMGVDGALLDLGSLVAYQSDTIVVGIGDGAQITEVITSGGNITGIKVDYGFNVADKNKNYGVRLQLANASTGINVRTYQLARFNSTGVKDTLTFATPIAVGSNIVPHENDIVAFGLYDKITTDAIVISKKENNDGTYNLTLVPYQNNIYDAELGIIPDFVSNVTSPKEAGEPVSEEIPSPTYEDVNTIAHTVVDEGSDEPPSPPVSFDVTAYQDYIELKCVHLGDSLTECIRYYEFQIQKGSSDPIVIQSGSPNFDYVFKRDVDGYPEASDLSNWTFKCRVVNVYDIPSSTWANAVTDTIDLSHYGTWQPAVPTLNRKEALQDGIAIEWQQATSSISGKNLYGSNEYEVKVFYNGTEIASHRTTGLNYVYAFDRSSNADGYPERPEIPNLPQTTKTLDNYSVTVKVINSSAKNATTSAEHITYANYKTWIPPEITVAKEIVDRTVILSALYNGDVYGNQKLLVKISRVGNKDLVDTESQQTFNDLLGIEEDVDANDNRLFYTPEFDKSVQTSDNADNEPNYRKNTQTAYEHIGYKITHTLPLIGQTYRIFKQDNVPLFNGAVKVTEVPETPSAGDKILYLGTTGTLTNGKYYVYDGSNWCEIVYKTKDISDYSNVPQSPTEGLIIHYTGNGEEQGGVTFTKNFYYLYEDSAWQQVFSKALIVPTTYIYSIQMTNESGNLSNLLDDIEVTAQPTNISDIVHSHEHYKDLYVEKLSAINANLGMISQGGMGEFKDWKNFWALSDLSAEDSGVAGGVKKGSFRVGGDDQFLEVMPDPDHEGQYLITLQAGNITLTSGSDASFKQGTYIYDKIDPKKRLALTSTGMIAQMDVSETEGVENWVNMAEVRTDELGNMIITNADDAPVVGVEVTGTIYHFDDTSHPFYEEVGEGVTPSNPEGLSGDGAVVSIDDDAIIKPISSGKSYQGAIQKVIGGNNSFTGTMVFFSKSEKITTSSKAIGIDGSVESAPDLLVGYNSAMRQTSQIDSSMTVGEYLGLNDTQVRDGIFY